MQHTLSGFLPALPSRVWSFLLIQRASQETFTPGAKVSSGGRMNGGLGMFSRLWVLQIPRLLSGGSSLAPRERLWASPLPLGWAPLAGHRRPILTRLRAILGVSTLPREGAAPREGWDLPTNVKGRKLGVNPCREPGWFRISPFRESRAHESHWLPLATRPFLNPEDFTVPHRSLWPRPSFQCRWVLAPVSCSQAGQDRQPEVSKL